MFEIQELEQDNRPSIYQVVSNGRVFVTLYAEQDAQFSPNVMYVLYEETTGVSGRVSIDLQSKFHANTLLARHANRAKLNLERLSQEETTFITKNDAQTSYK